MMAALEQRTGRRLPLLALFQEATPAHLARLLAAPASCPPEESLVPLQPRGSKTPLFAVHPAGGTVFCYQRLAACLDEDRPFHGIQAVGLDGLCPPHDCIEQMVAHYAAAIRDFQPRGPYLLAGWSLGGNVAFEIARQLTLGGETVGLLTLIDCGALPPERAPTEDDFLPIVLGLFPDDHQLTLEDLRQMPPEEHLEYFYQRALRAGVALPAFDRAVAARVFEVFKCNMRAMWQYRPQPYASKITLFRSEEQPLAVAAARDPLLGWGPYAAGGVEVHSVPGRHLEVIREPHVRALAAQLRRCLDGHSPGPLPPGEGRG